MSEQETTDEVMQWYVGQARFAVCWHGARGRFLVHDTAIGCYWEETFATYDEALTGMYRERHLLPPRRQEGG